MRRGLSFVFAFAVGFVSILLVQATGFGYLPPVPSDGGNDMSAETVYVDSFNRADGPLGPDWAADSTMQVVSNELDNIETNPASENLAVYSAHTNPIGVAYTWSASATSEGIDKGGLLLRLSDASTTASGYYIFKNVGDDKYALWTLENGARTTRITTVSSTLEFPNGGDDFQIVLRSDGGGHHFDIYYNDQFDVTITDPFKLQGNGATLYSGVLLGGFEENNVDDYTFVEFDDDVTPPAAISDLEVIPVSGSSLKLRWTAPGDDGLTGNAGSYDIRFSTYALNEGNWASAIKVIGEPRPSASGSLDSLTITNLQPETDYWFGVKTSDGFPKNNYSDLSNIVTGQTSDDVAPSQIVNLTVIGVGSRTALLSWTAPGDSDTLGTADEYDVRFSTSPITEDNFSSALRGVGEPTPGPYGTYQEFTCNKLLPSLVYYFAIRAEDEVNNRSLVSNSPMGETTLYPWATDEFDRQLLGEVYWVADPEIQIDNGALKNFSTEDRWDFSAIFQSVVDIKEAEYKWGDDVNASEAGSAGLVVGMDAADPDANGYLIFRNPSNDRVALWDVSAGVPSAQISSEIASSYDPQAGDKIRIVVSTDMNGNHFDYWVNGEWTERVSDPDKLHTIIGSRYAGLMIHGARDISAENFSISSPTATLPPAAFDLYLPFDGDTVSTGTPVLDWYDSYDLNPGDSVHYSVWYGTDPTFNINTTFVDTIWDSEYLVPGSQLGIILRNYLEEIVNGKGGGQNATMELPDNVEIFWRVRATDTTGLEAMATQIDWSFYVMIPDAPLPFALISPPDGVTVPTRNPTLVWHQAIDPDPDAESITYEVWYDRAPDFAHPTVIGGLPDTSFTLPTLLNFETYYWKVIAEDEDELRTESITFFSFVVDTTFLGVEDNEPSSPILPKMFAMGQNYPNPFNPRTQISYNVPESVSGEVLVMLDVFNVRGVKVRSLVNENKAAGQYAVSWDGTDNKNRKVSSGIYFYRMNAGDFTSTKKMVILK